MATKTLLAYSTDWAESFHWACEKASAIKVVRGRAVKKPAKPVFFPESHETKAMMDAERRIFPNQIILI